MKSLKYSNFVDRIDLDAVEDELGFEVVREEKGNDIGYCILPHGLHSNGDTTGKMGIHREKMVYNCWVCGGGSVLDLVMACKDLDIEQATDWLFQYTGSSDESGSAFMERIHKTMNRDKGEPRRLPYYNIDTVTKWFTDDHPWLAERGLSKEVAEIFMIGYNPQAVKYAPKKAGKPIDEPYRSEAIVLPHFWKGKLMGWQHRWLKDDRPVWCQKYTNTPDFPRENTLFGYDIATKVVQSSKEPVVVVESVPTAMFLTGLGIPAVATFGALIKEDQAKHLRAFQNGVILSPDNDAVSDEKYWETAGQLRRYVPVKWLEPHPSLPPKGDLNDLKESPELVRNYIGESSEWLFASTKR